MDNMEIGQYHKGTGYMYTWLTGRFCADIYHRGLVPMFLTVTRFFNLVSPMKWEFVVWSKTLIVGKYNYWTDCHGIYDRHACSPHNELAGNICGSVCKMHLTLHGISNSERIAQDKGDILTKDASAFCRESSSTRHKHWENWIYKSKEQGNLHFIWAFI